MVRTDSRVTDRPTHRPKKYNGNFGTHASPENCRDQKVYTRKSFLTGLARCRLAAAVAYRAAARLLSLRILIEMVVASCSKIVSPNVTRISLNHMRGEAVIRYTDRCTLCGKSELLTSVIVRGRRQALVLTSGTVNGTGKQGGYHDVN